MDRGLIDAFEIKFKSAFRNLKSAILLGAMLFAALLVQPKRDRPRSIVWELSTRADRMDTGRWTDSGTGSGSWDTKKGNISCWKSAMQKSDLKLVEEAAKHSRTGKSQSDIRGHHVGSYSRSSMARPRSLSMK